MLWMSVDLIKLNDFPHKKGKKQTTNCIMTGAEYWDDTVLLANTPEQAESLLHSKGQGTGVIDLYVNARVHGRNKKEPSLL